MERDLAAQSQNGQSWRPEGPSKAKGESNLVTSLVNRFARPALVALLLSGAAVFAAQSAQSVLTAQTDPFANMGGLPLYRSSVTGSYMAGQHALQDLRTEEAARYFYQAAQGEWDNPLLVERSFIAFAADGQIGRAASAAKHLLELDPANELAQLVVASEALKERRYGPAEKMLAVIGEDSFTGITASVLRAWALVGDNRVTEADAVMDRLGETG